MANTRTTNSEPYRKGPAPVEERARAFIEKARAVHGDRYTIIDDSGAAHKCGYDYSKVVYKGTMSKVEIACPVHGVFWQRPNDHLRGTGCPRCGKLSGAANHTLTNEQFIEKAQAVHGSKYSYDKVEYKNATTKVEIICPKHGSFWQKPTYHLNGNGCPECAGRWDISLVGKTQKFIRKARVVHGDRYRYDMTSYKNNHTKVCITCPVHGDFWQRPNDHLKGVGCPECGHLKVAGKTRLPQQDFIEKARLVHGNRYDYSLVEYKNSKTKVCITCSVHGVFWQRPGSHIRGQGCPKCGGKLKKDTALFIEKARAVHGDRYDLPDRHGGTHKLGYDYCKVEYKNIFAKVCITCPVHGDFWQQAAAHLNGQGCPKCNRSKLEVMVEGILKDQGIKYIPQHHPQWMGLQRLDFYLPDYNLAVECQGIQHYQSVEFFGGEAGFEDCKKRDALKAQKCKDNGARLLYIPYTWGKKQTRAAIERAIKEPGCT